MDFEDFSLQVPKIKNLPLPGTASHYKMAPEIRIKELKKGLLNGREPYKAGVMALFYPDALSKTHLILILRNTYPGVHSNQIGFPGGKQESEDRDLLETALRETHEEIGVPPSMVQVIRPITEVYIPPSNFQVQPFVGIYHKKVPFVPEQSEVAALVEVSLDDFMDDNKLITQNLSTSYAKNIAVPAFEFNGYTVWGATAMMLSEIKELFRQVL
ncbi:NUDIX hydrolase [Poritiphilus flavus]|uniref:NUDIX domain-containing protein n=1 Tax=Poritiphilus flavus TaxID=2697053 RepID=A0A6L9EBE0_9FLAO|nr:CoA pyrophosphatase [Poritiphilus flavus]NAS12066.1 NUDIX domain-containing protein [Poritiphilus flavus]